MRTANRKLALLLRTPGKVTRQTGLGLLAFFVLGGFALPLLAHTVQSATGQTVPTQIAATVTGTVRDSQGNLLGGIRLVLVGPNGTVKAVTISDSTGAYTFAGIAPGAYVVKINGTEGAPAASTTVTVEAGSEHVVPFTVFQIPAKVTTLNVTATLDDVAREQVKEEEKQRILGFLPNYYTSYIWDAAPMKPKLKFKLALRTTMDPFTFVVVAGIAGVEQAHKTFPGYGQGTEGYAKRYGSSYADVVAGRMLGSAIFPTLLHQDPRYFYRGSGSVSSRVFYALVSTVICRGDNGQLEPNYSHVLGSFTAAGLSNLYRDAKDRGAGLTFRNGLIITGSEAVVNLLREFYSRQLTSSVPKFAKGKRP